MPELLDLLELPDDLELLPELDLPDDLDPLELDRPDDLELLTLEDELLEDEERPELLTELLLDFDFFDSEYFRFLEELLAFDLVAFLSFLRSFLCLATFFLLATEFLSLLELLRLTSRVDSLELPLLVALEPPASLVLEVPLSPLDRLAKSLF